MAIRRVVMAIVVLMTIQSSAMARADADHDASTALADYEAAQIAYALALEQVQVAKAALDAATAHAIAAGVLSAPENPTPPAAEDPKGNTPAQNGNNGGAAENPKPKPPKPDPKPEPKKEPPKEVQKKKEKGPSFWKNWKRSVRVGFNTASGNSENTNLNLQFHTQRRSKKYFTKFDAEYRYATRNGRDSQNRWGVIVTLRDR